jgi:uncharacterized protein (DUF4415 family)
MPKRRPPLTDEEGEVRELTAKDFKGMRPLREVDPGFIAAMEQFRKKVGRPKAASPKVHISFRLAAEVVESIKATGEGYNARVEQVLRDAFVTARDPRSEMSKLKSVASKIMNRSYQRSGVVAGGTLLSSAATQATEHAIKTVVASQLKAMMEQQHLTKAALAKQLHTSRSQIERVLDPNNDDVTSDVILRLAKCL